MMEPKNFTDVQTFFLPPHEKITYAKDQPEYRPLPTVRLNGPEGRVISKWELSDDERARIAAGAELYIEQLTFREPLQPILPTIGLRDFCPIDSQ